MRLVLPGTSEYEEARKPEIERFHGTRPRAVVLCASEDDVVEALAYAGDGPVAVRSGGHCFAGRSSTPGVVIDVSPLRSIEVAGGLATVGAGARLGDVYDALAEHGITIPAGCGATVGIAGLALGGGLGILGRKYGLTCDHLVAAQVVLPDGQVVECDERRDAELFWALRGAGAAGFGVVTELTFRTVPAPDATSFHLVWPYEQAAAVIGAWQGLAPDAPDETAASLLVTAGSDPAKPPRVNVFGAMLAGEDATRAWLDGLAGTVGARPARVLTRYAPHRETKRFLAESEVADEAGPHGFIKSGFFRESLPAGAVERLVRDFVAGRVPGESRELDFSPWQGAYNRVPQDATAFVHRKERFLLKLTAGVPAGREPSGWLAGAWETVRPWWPGGVYPNFPEPGIAALSPEYHGTNLGRLAGIRRLRPGSP